MKNTIKLLEEQYNVLVQVIQFLDSNRHSDTPVREAVDKILNHSDKLHKGSELELESHELGKLTEC
jgi:hypothetical protein